MTPPPEMGEELAPGDLQVETIVFLRAIHRPDIAITAWVDTVAETFATFYMGATNTTLGLRIKGGKFFDDMNHRIYVHRYLGEP